MKTPTRSDINTFFSLCKKSDDGDAGYRNQEFGTLKIDF